MQCGRKWSRYTSENNETCQSEYSVFPNEVAVEHFPNISQEHHDSANLFSVTPYYSVSQRALAHTSDKREPSPSLVQRAHKNPSPNSILSPSIRVHTLTPALLRFIIPPSYILASEVLISFQFFQLKYYIVIISPCLLNVLPVSSTYI
jgi:hypothetical protein